MQTHLFTVRGQTLSTRTKLRYAVVAVRPEAVPAPEGGWYVAFGRIEKRTDSLVTALRERNRLARPSSFPGPGVEHVVIDLVTYTEV